MLTSRPGQNPHVCNLITVPIRMSWLLVSGRVMVAARAIERYDSRGTFFDKKLTDPLSALGPVSRSPAAPMRGNMTGMSEQGALEQGERAGRVERQTTSDLCRIFMLQTMRPRLISKRPPSPLPSTRTCRSDRYRPHRDKARSFLGNSAAARAASSEISVGERARADPPRDPAADLPGPSIWSRPGLPRPDGPFDIRHAGMATCSGRPVPVHSSIPPSPWTASRRRRLGSQRTMSKGTGQRLPRYTCLVISRHESSKGTFIGLD